MSSKLCPYVLMSEFFDQEFTVFFRGEAWGCAPLRGAQANAVIILYLCFGQKNMFWCYRLGLSAGFSWRIEEIMFLCSSML